MFEILIAVSTIALLYILYKKTRPGTNTPPLLPWLPIVGSLPFLSEISSLHICFMEKSKRYGNVFSLNCGQRYAVVLNGYEAIREALVSRAKDFAGREKVYIEEHVMNPNLKGLAFRQYDEDFKFVRKTSVAVLKKFGFGQHSTMETKIHEEIKQCMKYIHAKNGIASNVKPILRISIMNIIHNIMFGKRFEAGDHTGEFLSNGLLTYMTSFHPTIDLFPISRFLPKFKKILQDVKLLSFEWKKFFDKKIKECLNSSSDEENFIKEYSKISGHKFDPSEPYFLVKDFLLGGTDAVTSQLLWLLILLSNHPRIQKRLQEEVDGVVKREMLPSLNDNLPYVEATMLEVMRLKTSVPLSLPHKTTCDTQVSGFFIPADTQVRVNLWSAHMDSNTWPEPDVFRPERFLNENGEVVNGERMIGFGLGKRSCPGEVLARHEMFLFIAALVQQFDILPPEGQTSIPDHGTTSLQYTPDPFEVRFIPRTL